MQTDQYDDASSQTSDSRAARHADDGSLRVIDKSAETVENNIAFAALFKVIHRIARFVSLDDNNGARRIILADLVRDGAREAEPCVTGSLENSLDLGNVAGALWDESEDSSSVFLIRRQAEGVRASVRTIVEASLLRIARRGRRGSVG